MKRIITSTLIVIIMLLCVGWLSNQEHTYTRQVTVHNTQDNILTVVDSNYNVWSYTVDDTTQYNKGDILTVVMSDNYTDSNIKDDIIINIKWRQKYCHIGSLTAAATLIIHNKDPHTLTN